MMEPQSFTLQTSSFSSVNEDAFTPHHRNSGDYDFTLETESSHRKTSHDKFKIEDPLEPPPSSPIPEPPPLTAEDSPTKLRTSSSFESFSPQLASTLEDIKEEMPIPEERPGPPSPTLSPHKYMTPQHASFIPPENLLPVDDKFSLVQQETTLNTTFKVKSKSKKDTVMNNFKEISEEIKKCIVNCQRKELSSALQRYIKFLKEKPEIWEHRDKYYELLHELIISKDSIIRGNGLRGVRYLLINEDMIEYLLSYHIDLYLIRALERDKRYVWERMQSLKCIKKWIEMQPLGLPTTIISSIVAVASDPDDNFRRVCLESLRILALHNPIWVSECRGITTLFDSLLEPSLQDVADSILLSLLFIMEDPKNKKYIRVNLELESVIAPYTEDNYCEAQDKKKKWECCHQILLLCMRNWISFLILSSPTSNSGLKSLIDLLTLPASNELKTEILNLFSDILGLCRNRNDNNNSNNNSINVTYTSRYLLPAWNKRKIMVNRSQNVISPQTNLLTSYLSLLLYAFINNNLFDALTYLSYTSTDDKLSSIACSLMSEILRLSYLLITDKDYIHLATLDRLVSISTQYTNQMDDPILQRNYIRATAVIHKQPGAPNDNDFTKLLLDSLYTNVNSTLLFYCEDLSNLVSMINLIEKHHIVCLQAPLLDRNVQCNRVFTTNYQTFHETNHLGKLIKSTQILQNKDPHNWNWNTVVNTFQFALLNEENTIELYKTKFMKRISEFMLPVSEEGNDNILNIQFTLTLSPVITTAVVLWTRVCMATADGLNILKDNKYGNLMDLLYKNLHSLLEISMTSTETTLELTQLFSPSSVQRTKSSLYIVIIATLLHTENGTNLLKETKIFDILKSMTRSPRFDYIARLLLSRLSYSDNEASRELIQGWCTFGTKSLRLFILGILRSEVRKNSPNFHVWGIPLLASQLSLEQDVSSTAISVLYEAIDKEQNLEAFLSCKPQLNELNNAGYLFMKMIKYSEGFEKLRSWVMEELSAWQFNGLSNYVTSLESALAEGFDRTQRRRVDKSSPCSIPFWTSRKYIEDILNGGEMSLEWLLWIPFKIEIISISRAGGITLLNTDTYVDLSHIRKHLYESGCTIENDIRICANVISPVGLSTPYPIQTGEELHAMLFIGSYFVTQNGELIELKDMSINNIISKLQDSPYVTKLTHSTLRKFVLEANQNAQSSTICSEQNSVASWFIDLTQKSSKRGLGGNTSSIPVATTATAAATASISSMKSKIASSSTTSIATNTNTTVQQGNTNQNTPFLTKIEFTLDIQPAIPLSTPIPDHLYGCLAKTKEGCDILNEYGNLEKYNSMILSNETTLLEKKQSLWALGHVYTTRSGCELLNDKLFTEEEIDGERTPVPSFFPMLVELAERSVHPSLRGTAYFIMGLISSNTETIKEIEPYGWKKLPHSPIPISLPENVNEIFNLDTESSSSGNRRNRNNNNNRNRYDDSSSSFGGIKLKKNRNGSSSEENEYYDDEEDEEFDEEDEFDEPLIYERDSEPIHLNLAPEDTKKLNEMMRFISGLCNLLSFKKCAASLVRMKKDFPSLFSDGQILLSIHRFVSCHHLRLQQRRALFPLFDEALFSSFKVEELSE